ncbi:hypothetical protein LCGC14_2783410, partial [marine sediment metagenome]
MTPKGRVTLHYMLRGGYSHGFGSAVRAEVSVYSALVSAWKPSSRWLPSQNGLLLEPPQRQ